MARSVKQHVKLQLHNASLMSEDSGSNLTPHSIEGIGAVVVCSLAASGDLPTLAALLETNKNLALEADYDKRTALHLACEEGHFDIVMLLVSHGANVNAIDKFGTTPLRIAINKERADIAAFLRENGAHLTLDAGEGDNKSQQTLELCRVVFDSLDSTRKGDSIPAEALKKWLKRNAGINLRYHKQAGLEFDNLRTDNTIPWSKYSEMMLTPDSLLQRALNDDLAIPQWAKFCESLVKIYNEVKALPLSGKNATYIPELGAADPTKFGFSVCTVDGQVFTHGAQDDFPIESCATSFLYSLLVESMGYENFHQHVGKEPSGASYNSFTLNELKKPHNPCVNTGSIAMCSMYGEQSTPSSRFKSLLKGVNDFVGDQKIGFSQTVYLSEKATANRNFALAYYMASQGALQKHVDIQDTMDFYFQLCSVEMNCEQLAMAGGTYANYGTNPLTHKNVLSADTCKKTLAILYACGMYNHSGEWACTVGLPAKSGVSGCILLVVPGLLGLAIYSPPIDENGNSVKAMQLARRLAAQYKWNIFDVLYAHESDTA